MEMTLIMLKTISLFLVRQTKGLVNFSLTDTLYIDCHQE